MIQERKLVEIYKLLSIADICRRCNDNQNEKVSLQRLIVQHLFSFLVISDGKYEIKERSVLSMVLSRF